MNLLLDSHVFIWMDIAQAKLSAAVQQAITDPKNDIYLSLVSIWEMQIKIQLGKLSLNSTLPLAVQSQKKTNNLQILSLEEAHIYTLKNLPAHHGDPFDRLLIAQAQTEKFTLVSNDSKISQYSVTLLW